MAVWKTKWRAKTYINSATTIAATAAIHIPCDAVDSAFSNYNDASFLNNSTVTLRIDVGLSSNPNYFEYVRAGDSWVLSPEDGEIFDGTIRVTNTDTVNQVDNNQIIINKAVKELVTNAT